MKMTTSTDYVQPSATRAPPAPTCLAPPTAATLITGVSHLRWDGFGLRDICRAQYSLPIGCKNVSEDGVGVRDPRVFVGSPAFPRERSWPSCHGRRDLPAVYVYRGNERCECVFRCDGVGFIREGDRRVVVAIR